MYWLVLHEITHILGFARPLFDLWKSADGRPLGMYNIMRFDNTGGKSRDLLVTPSVVAEGKRYFN